MMALCDQELMNDFMIESREGLALVESQMLAIESNGFNVDLDLVNAVFRTMHSIKGAAGFLGLETIGALAHALEEILDDMRCREIAPDATIVSSILKSSDVMKRLVEAPDDSNEVDVSSLIGELNALRAEVGDCADATPTHAHSRLNAATDSKSDSVAQLKQSTSDSRLEEATNATEEAEAVAKLFQDEAKTASEPTSKGNSDTTIRVDVALLDKLMTRVGELVLARNQILQKASSTEDALFASTAQRLNLITTELQEGVMKTRMQTIGNVWSKFPRVVRDLASQLSKRVQIQMEGHETELDKTIIEAIKDPLTHVVRNSVDHGIESPAERIAAGKNADGCLRLRAYHEGGQVVIEIEDDGRGLDVERIMQKALERGLISAEQAHRMNSTDAAQLILLPGFSTARTVTNISGRGVGMDVVKTNIERIGGTLDIRSRSGLGLLVKIKIPLTLAIIPALVVSCDGDRFAIPQVSLLELVRLDGDQAGRGIEFIDAAPVYRLRGKLLPLVSLSERLGMASPLDDAGKLREDVVFNIVVLRANELQFGLIVDQINDTEEIVVKPLSSQLKGISEYAGATIMGDGKVALILDVMSLAVAAGVSGNIQDRHHANSVKGRADEEGVTHTLLVVEDESGRRFALPTSMVSRLESARAKELEHACGREVMQYRGAILPLVRISDAIPVTTQSDDDATYKVVVYSDRNRSCGLIVKRIVDIVNVQINLSGDSEQAGRLLGTAIVQNSVTDVLNLRHLADEAACIRQLS